MKVALITVPMKPPDEIFPVIYPVDGDESIYYGKPVRCPINGVLAKIIKNGEKVKVIYILATGENSECEHNKNTFMQELENINAEIGAVLTFDSVEMEFMATKQIYSKLLTDLVEKIPEKAEIYTDITYGFKPEALSLFCSLRFVEEFHESIVQNIIYGKLEFNKTTKKPEHPMLFDITSLYYFFKLIGTMGTTDAGAASQILKEFFAI